MKLEELVQILQNRLADFKLARDYAKMNGDLKRLNDVEKEILELEDTIYKLGLLLETEKSAAVKETVLSEAITTGSVAVLEEYDISPYATDPLHKKKIMDILSRMGPMDTVEKIDAYIRGKYPSSPVTGEMVMNAASAYNVDARLMMALMEQDSRFGTVGVAVKTRNPGNIGNDDDGNLRFYDSWQEGVTAVAEWLNNHRVSKIASQNTENTESVATSTPAILESTSTIATSTPEAIATSTITNVTSTTQTAPSTTGTDTSTPETTATSTTEGATSTETSTSTPPTDTTSTSTISTSTSTEGTSTSTPIKSTSTSTTATSTTETATSTLDAAANSATSTSTSQISNSTNN